MEENSVFISIKHKYDILYSKLEENLSEEDKKTLHDLNSKADKVKL